MIDISIVLSAILGYVIGSIPWALIIGKVFFKKDIRDFGSHNLGGTNAGRVLGLHIGIIVILLDSSKALLAMYIASKVFNNVDAIAIAGFIACLGHSWPLFAKFKGGKSVATGYGFLLGLGIFITKDIVFILVYPLLSFLIILGYTKYVSLSSMLSLIIASIIAFLTFEIKLYAYLVLILTLIVIYRHRANINRLLNNKESKIKFIK